ncbi:MAG: lytic transglycosylase domain-containing protein [Clostridia bacterium]|nr:lytic transglycosylase domain-containing protein [Clostridia bacterium]
MKKRTTVIIVVCIAVIIGMLAILFIAAPAVMKMRYKLDYEETIAACAEEFGLEPAMVCAVIHTESKFKSDAVSHAGAVGLMQIMPATGAEIADGLSFENFDESVLQDPKTNIRFGCYYLSRLIERFDGNIRVALAAYNAGPARAEEWERQYGLDEEGGIKYIPYPETDNYVGRVMRAYDVYDMLYSDRWD